MLTYDVSPNMEIIQLKMDVAKEREINACLRDEISSVKVNFKREIRLLQETIDIQNQVIDQLKVKNEMKDEVCDILETAQEEDSFEVDLSLEAEAWIIEAESFDTADEENNEDDIYEDESTEAEEEASFVIAKENFFEDHEESLHDSLLDTSESFSDYESSIQTSNSSISTPKNPKIISKIPKAVAKRNSSCQKKKTSQEDEGYKIIIELSKEIDSLKTSLSSSEEDLLVYKNKIAELETDLETSKCNEHKLLIDCEALLNHRDDLSRDILDIKLQNERELNRLEIALSNQRIRNEHIETKLKDAQRTLRRTNDYFSWTRLLSDYVVIA